MQKRAEVRELFENFGRKIKNSNFPKFYVDKQKTRCYYNKAFDESKTKYARVVELADSLDSGSSAHSGRAGSSPASRTKRKTTTDGSRFLFYVRGFGGKADQMGPNKAVWLCWEKKEPL